MKIQSLYFSKAGNSKEVADKIARVYKCKSDQIPPAYQPEREAVVFISMEPGKLDAKLVNFCKSLTPAKTKNIAICVVGTDVTGGEELKGIVSGTGVNVIEVHHLAIKKAGIFGKAKVTDADINSALEWAAGIVKGLED